MAKFTIPSENTKFDPVKDQLKSITDLGLTPVVSGNDKFSLSEQSDRLNSFSNVKASDYGDNVSLLGSDAEAQLALDETRARRQSAGEQLFKGLGHIGSTIGTEILKTPGYLLGGLGALANDKSVIENIVDNDWVNAFESLDETLKEAMPVHLKKEVEEGNIGRKLMSSAWWATTGADGIGFLLSMYVPGQAVKALGTGARIGAGLEALAQEAKFAKVLTATNILKNTKAGAKMTAKGMQRAESTAAVAMNTYIESAAEAANTFDNVKKTFLDANPNATEEDASKIASEAAANVMKANVGLLIVSNVFDELFLFKGFGRSAEKAAAESTLGKIFKNGVIDPVEAAKLKKLGVKDFIKQAPMKLATNQAKEGLFEEGLQFQIQNHYENVASGKTKASFTEDVFGNYFENLMTNPDMQEAVVLGGILGGGASMFGLASDIKSKNEMMFGKGSSTPSMLGKFFNKKNKTESKGLINIMQENFINSTRTIHDIAEMDENGKPVTVDGKIQINEEKMKQMVEQKEGLLLLNQLHNMAILEGNKSEENYFGDLLSYNYFLPFLQQEGGFEVLNQHISNQLVEMMAKKQEGVTGVMPNDKAKTELKDKLLAKAAEYKKIYDEVDTTTNTEINVPVDNPATYNGWKQSVRDRKMQALVAYNSAERGISAMDGLFGDFGIDLSTEPDLTQMSPAEVVRYKDGIKIKKEYQERLDTAKAKYIELSEKKTLKEDYDKFKKGVEEDAKAMAEAIEEDEKETQAAIDAQLKSSDFESQLNTAGFSTSRQEGMKGFALQEPRVILENEKGERVTLEVKYNKATNTLEHFTKDKNGKETKVTDAEGNYTAAFSKQGFKPISAEQIKQERTALNIKRRKESQLQLLNEFIYHRNRTIGTHEKELEDIKKELEQYDNEMKNIQNTIDNLHAEKVNGKVRTKKQLKIRQEELQQALSAVKKTIDNLQNRKNYLESTIPRIQMLVAEYEQLKEDITNSDTPFAFKQELARIEEAMKVDNLIPEIRSVITDIESKIASLTILRDTIEKVLASHSVFSNIIKLKEAEYEKAFSEFDNFFAGIPVPYGIRRINQIIGENVSQVLAGETLTKNNIISNAVEIASWLNANPDVKFAKFGINEPITELDIYEKMIDIFTPYVANMEELNKQYPYTPEEIYSLQSQVFVTNRELDALKKELDSNKELLRSDPLYRRYSAIQGILTEKVEARFNQIQAEKMASDADTSQIADVNSTEVAEEPSNMRDIFLEHALPQTPFSTTGISVKYDDKGKDRTDDEGFPILNENEFQRAWFQTIDELADTITEYTLTPVRATYDNSDDVQQTLAANFPDVSRRGTNDIFVFLTDKDGNKVKRNGVYVFTSVRKVSEVYPQNGTPRVAPDYLLNEYLNSIGIVGVFNYEGIKKQKIGDFIQGKEARELLKDMIENDNTGEDLFSLAIEHGRKEYQKFLDELGANTDTSKRLQIQEATKGYPLYQLDEEGKKRRHPVLDIFGNLSITPNTFGTKQLVGGKLGVIANTQVKVGGKFISLAQGTVYLQFDNEEFIVLQPRKLKNTEVHTVLRLLAMADGNQALNTIVVESPDGYTLNGRNIGKNLPVFFKKTQTGGESFSLLETMINYGLRAPGKNKKGEIYIQSGNVVFTDFDGTFHKVALADITEAFKTNDQSKIATLVSFLKQKNFNINNTMLANNPKFQYPVFENGKLRFKNNESYYSFILGEVLTTSSVVKDGYPKKLQRNVVYSPKLGEIAKAPIKQVAAPPVVLAPSTRETKQDIIDKQIKGATSLFKARGEEPTRQGLIDQFTASIPMAKRFSDAGFELDSAAINAIADGVMKNFEPEVIAPVVETPVVQETTEEVKTEPAKKLTPAERLAKLKGEASVGLNTTPAADKRIDPEELLERYIKNKIVQKICN